MSEVKFFNAICDGDIKTLKILLEINPDLVHSRHLGSAKSCLHVCFEKRHHDGKYCECLELLVDQGADINEICKSRRDFYHSWTPIMFVVHVKCLRCLKFLIENGADLSIETSYGDTALLFAVKEREFTIVETLIQHSTPALINHRDPELKTALMWAAACKGDNTPSVCQKLIEAGANLNITNRDGETALICAVKSRKSRCAGGLIQHSNLELINHRDNGGKTALMWAAECHGKDALSIIQKLIEAGADLNITDAEGNTALIHAVKKNNITLAEYFIQISTHELINHRGNFGRTALMWTVDCDRQDAYPLIKKLIEAGADVKMSDKNGGTALILAVTKKNITFAEYLIQRSTPELINHKDNLGRTALMWAAWSDRYNALSLIQKLVEAGADVNITDKDGKTALIHAVKHSITRKEVRNADILIERSTPALINHKDNGGKTALMWAAKCHGQNAFSLIEKLIEAGADLNITDAEGNTALILAVKHAATREACRNAEVLIQHSTPALMNHRDNGGRTALMWAADRFKIDSFLCQELIKAGTDLNIIDNYGTTTLIQTVKKSKDECAKLLIPLSTPALINQRDNGGRTALMWAILDNHNRHYDYHIDTAETKYLSQRVSICEHFIEAGADVNLNDNNGETALSFALEKENEKVVSLLLEKGAFANTISISGKTLLYQAFVMKNWSRINQLFIKGADPTLSFRHKEFIHQSISNNNAATLRKLVINGFPPQDCTVSNNSFLHNICNPPRSASPLSLALWEGKPVIARYLIKNKFFTCSDINQTLAQNTELRQRLTKFRLNECFKILKFHLQTVQTLSTLCLATITSALTQDFREDDNVRGSSSGKWRFRPTFKERVESLELPVILQRALLHQTRSSRICCKEWENISLEEKRQFPDCDECGFCTSTSNFNEFSFPKSDLIDSSESDLIDSSESDEDWY